MRAEFDSEAQESGKERLRLSAGVSAEEDRIQAGYEIDKISQ